MLGRGHGSTAPRQGHRVTLIESAPRLGGLASAQSVGDGHMGSLLPRDPPLRFPPTRPPRGDRARRSAAVGNDTDRVLHRWPFSTRCRPTWSFLRFPPLSLVDKMRLGWTILHASSIKDGLAAGEPDRGGVARAAFGGRTYERIWRPLLRAKLGEHYDRASAASSGPSSRACTRPGARAEAGDVRVRRRRIRHDPPAPARRARITRGRSPLRAARYGPFVAESGMVEVHLAGGDTLAFDDAVLTVPCAR